MKANCYWQCQDCRCTNLTQLSTADEEPKQLVCEVCKASQDVRLSLVNFVKEG